MPSYLKNQADLYATTRTPPRWRGSRRRGSGCSCTTASTASWAAASGSMYREAIPVAEYEKLKEQFRPDKFDADRITDMAAEAGMRYVNITSRHHDSFCLFESKHSDYTSVASPAKRDLVGELAEQCRKKGLGLFLYYSYALGLAASLLLPAQVRSDRAAGLQAAGAALPVAEGRGLRPLHRVRPRADHGAANELRPAGGHLVRSDHGLLRAAGPVPDRRDLRMIAGSSRRR